jgi:3-phenylpropionate/cinnamic acid dioxygenase small subunit
MQGDDRESIRALIARSGRLLDEGRFADYVELFATDGQYLIEARSAEIGRDMVWLSLNRTELAELFREWPLHVRDAATRTHLIAVDEISFAGADAHAFSTFTVYRTDERGRSEFYCVGRYEDQLCSEATVWKIKRRSARLETRLLVTPTPLPV